MTCKWLTLAKSFAYGTPENRDGHSAHTGFCAPQHNDEDASCPHNASPANVCTCEVEDNLGWVLKWNEPKHDWQFDADGVERMGYEWVDAEDTYSIYEFDDSKGAFHVVCFDGEFIGTMSTLEEAKALAQREYAGIKIAFHGSRTEEEEGDQQ